MRLFYSPASPFARKCRVLIREKGLLAHVEEVKADPIGGDAALTAINPIGQVPALIDDDGVAWVDSPLICQRLDLLGPAPKFIPEGEARWEVLRREVIADGVMELGVKARLEVIRPDGERSASWIARWRAGMLRAIETAAKTAPAPDAPLDQGAVALVCALTWVDFRHPDLDWRDAHPNLVRLQQGLEAHPSFRETAPA
jgi:glutathione S-transferase